MEYAKKRIQKLAGILRVLCVIATYVLKAVLVGTIVFIIVIFCNQKLIAGAEVVSNSFLFQTLQNNGILDGMENTYQAAIALFIAFINFLVTLFYVNFFRDILTVIAKEDRPFQLKLAKKLRRVAWLLIFVVLYAPLVGAVLFLITLLFSYLFEYGAYLQEQADQTQHIQEEMILSFAEISENKSGQTGQHIRRVAEYTKILALEMGMSEKQAEALRLASTMHDIGKLIIPSEILDKPGRLTDEVFAVIKTHTTYGGQLLENVEGDIMELARIVALEHHEKMNGKGYPAGKSGDEISLEGRIVAVADVYDALTSRRSYKVAWSEKEAYDEIVRCSGTQFDPQVVEAFQRAYDRIDAVRRKYTDERGSVCA